MKTNKEIIEYLKPYTQMKGNYYSTLVEIDEKVRGFICDVMVVRIDIKSSWIGVGGVDTRHQTIKQHLTKNGFRYSETGGCYIRPIPKKYWK